MKINNEDHILLNDYLDTVLFNGNKNKPVSTTLELIIRPECNQKCEYCYLYKHGHDLYPKEKRANNDTLIKNLTLFFNYLLKRESYLSSLEIFAGDLFYDDFFFEMIEIVYNYYEAIYKINPNIFANKSFLQGNPLYSNRAIIMIPCNCSFCNDKNKIKKFKEIFNRLLDINVYLTLSYSSDGIYASGIREKHSLSEEFLDNVFTLLYDCNYGVHPMISYESIDNAIQNYEWWKLKLSEYNKKYHYKERYEFIPCMLEVRNEGWTDETITKYIEFLNYMIDDRLKICNNNLEHLAFDIFCHNSDNQTYERFGPPDMDPIKPIFTSYHQNYASCSLGHGLCIQCNDLTLVPCHRLAYPFYHGGKFNYNDNEITEIIALENMNGYLNQIHCNSFFNPLCCTCDYQGICIKGCHGAQFEAMSDPNIPIPDICQLFKTKANFLIHKYNELGVLKIAINNGYLTDSAIKAVNKILNILKEDLK